jgi:hypothetical protein
MKRLRYLVMALVLGLGFALRAPAQTVAQNLTISLICQYVTNDFTNNYPALDITNRHQEIVTVLIDTANLVKAMAIDLEGRTNSDNATNWLQWAGAAIVLEQNMITTNQGIFLRKGLKQTNVSPFFGSSFTNLFSQDISTVFVGTNYATSLPLLGGYSNTLDGASVTNFSTVGNLAYVNFSSSNTSFNLFGFSQGNLINVFGRSSGTLYSNTVNRSLITGAGTFSLNVTTNVYLDPSTNTVPAYYTGIAHGTVNVNAPYFLNIPGP